jgi:hypothetical protein
MSNEYDLMAAQVTRQLPGGLKVVVIGSSSFWQPESESLCGLLGRQLARLPQIVLITGGVAGVGEAVGRSFWAERHARGYRPDIYHVLPSGSAKWDYGTTLFAGADMLARREVLGRLAPVYVVIEGGPGTAHEARVARARSALLIPISRSGGHAAELYDDLPVPKPAAAALWRTLGDASRPLHEVALATASFVSLGPGSKV